MTKQEIVDKLAQDRTLEKFIAIKGQGWIVPGTELDLAQDMYLDLLSMPATKLEELYSRGELNYYLVRAVQNQCRGPRTYYNKKYRQFSKRSVEINEQIDQFQD